jgi:rhamnulokinase
VSTSVVAVDFGATSIRVCRVDLDARPMGAEVVHRFVHEPVRESDGSLRWGWPVLLAEMERGLDAALARGPVASIGIDTWGVDYGLIDVHGELLSSPHCYRSARTSDFGRVVERIGERRLYEIAGVQLQPFNTIFQVAAHDRAELSRAHALLLLPDLLVHHLTGARFTERTAAGTTGLLDVRTRDWSDELIDATGASRTLFTDIVDPGTGAGRWHGIPVTYVGGHDTASAVAAMATDDGTAAFVSAGTWMLVGREQPQADTSSEAQTANFTNEIGVGGRIRFLKNLAGFWMFEECRRSWGSPDASKLFEHAASIEDGYDVFDTSDPRFLAPADMDAEVRGAARVAAGAPHAVVVRAIVESMAASAARVVDELGGVRSLVLTGGGAGLPFLVEALERRTGCPVAAGPSEATALGNALVQGVAIGRFADLEGARAALA